jgi:hypothetical protein
MAAVLIGPTKTNNNNNNIPLIKKVNKLQSSHYRNLSKGSLVSEVHNLGTTVLDDIGTLQKLFIYSHFKLYFCSLCNMVHYCVPSSALGARHFSHIRVLYL